MNADASPAHGAQGALQQLVSRGEIADGLALALDRLPGGPALVRPVVDDVASDWVAALEEALGPRARQKIGIASADPSLAARLACEAAAWLADRGRKVTVVDASIESPVIAKALSGDGDEGLVDVVAFGVSPAVAARRTLATGVTLMTAGSYALAAGDVFQSRAFGDVLDELAGATELVFVVLAAQSLANAASALTTVVAVGLSEREIESLVRETGSPSESGTIRKIAVLVAGARAPATPAVEPPDPAASHLGTEADRSGEAPESGTAHEPLVVGTGPDEPLVSPSPGPSQHTADLEESVAPPRSEVSAQATDAQERAESLGPDTSAVETGVRRRPPLRALLAVGAVVVVAAAALGLWRTGAIRTLGWDSSSRGPAATTERRRSVGPVDAEGTGIVSDAQGRSGKPAGTAVATKEGSRALTAAPTGTSPHTAVPVPTERISRGSGGPYIVFTSSHRLESAAQSDALKLSSIGFATVIAQTELEERGTWFRVVVEGGYPTLAEAREALGILHQLGYDGAWIEMRRED